MNHYARRMIDTHFVRGLISHVPELRDVWTRCLEEDHECIPAFIMRDISHELVRWVQDERAQESPHRQRVLKRSFEYLDAGMRQGHPIDDLLRHTVCHEMGAQSANGEVFRRLLAIMGPATKQWLVCVDGSMPFRDDPEALWTPGDTPPRPSRPTAPAPSDREEGRTPHREVLLKSNWSYTLYRESDALFLSMVVGSVGLDTLTIKLTEEERERYVREGEGFISEWVRAINASPRSYGHRRVNASPNTPKN